MAEQKEEDDSEWFELPNIKADSKEGQETDDGQAAGAGEGPAQEAEAVQEEEERIRRQPVRERWEVALGPWREKVNSPSPRARKRKQQAARRRGKEEAKHPYKLRNRKGREFPEEEELSD